MKLTHVLLFYKNLMKVPGSLYAGKHRVYRPIKMKDRREAFNRLMKEQQNLAILSRPYLTMEEEQGHMKAMGRNRLAYEALKERNTSKMLPHRTIEDHLEHVNTGRKWE
ncbi:large ribosomal subunit protein mL63-like [Liolophura sinensis]|uniref:large ribosomal subunit protein mL63-like n=1 Tax=Liolophura sinensis TaxID=3198878 RepID=UPI00315880A9